MARRTNSFARALKDAEKRLQEALNQRSTAIAQLSALEAEIPRLQQIIASLSGKPEAKVAPETAGLPIQPPPPNLGPEKLAKWYSDRDLSGMGSIVPVRTGETAPQSEDETLPDDFEVKK